jgi:2-polyprenyl-3-methyl-5-hydroxy-6-metoxy-1,4-benzoquinol methylase
LKIAIRNAILEVHKGYNNLNNNLLVKELGKVFSLIKPIKERAELSVMSLDRNNSGKLLDIGCGSGQFLAKMQHLGWEVVGLDSDERSVKLAKKRFNLDVRKGTIEQVYFPEDAFDAITMSHVIEHLVDPIGSLRECRRILRKGGKLIILTPNIESLGSRIFGHAWFPLDPPRHLYLFSSSSLRICAERANLNIQELRTTARSAYGTWGISYLIQKKGVLTNYSRQKYGPFLKLKGLSFWAIENGFSCTDGFGEELVLVATKDKD